MWKIVSIFLVTLALIVGMVGCDGYGSRVSHTQETRTTPLGYFELTVSPAEVCANIDEQIEIRCTIECLINTPVEISSVDVLLFDSCDYLVREQRMVKDSYWSFHTAYTIIGDEAYYQIKFNFRFISLSESGQYTYSGEHTEYGADSFPIVVET